jgi:hypothetical protein
VEVAAVLEALEEMVVLTWEQYLEEMDYLHQYLEVLNFMQVAEEEALITLT